MNLSTLDYPSSPQPFWLVGGMGSALSVPRPDLAGGPGLVPWMVAVGTPSGYVGRGQPSLNLALQGKGGLTHPQPSPAEGKEA